MVFVKIIYKNVWYFGVRVLKLTLRLETLLELVKNWLMGKTFCGRKCSKIVGWVCPLHVNSRLPCYGLSKKDEKRLSKKDEE